MRQTLAAFEQTPFGQRPFEQTIMLCPWPAWRVVLSVLSLLMIVASLWSPYPLVAVVLALLLSGGLYQVIGTAEKPAQLGWTPQQGWWWREQGERQVVQPVWAWLPISGVVLLHLTSASWPRSRRVLLWPSAAPDAHRRLRVLLRWAQR